jgi:predicted RNase H-like HicB family nuclease
MDEYPLLFTYREVVTGDGFMAGVILDGRALLVDEKEDGWWAYGVEPGALSETGDTPHEALFYYRQAYASVIADLARDANGSFERFQAMAEAFFAQKDAKDEARWHAARQVLQSDQAKPHAALGGLPREKAESPRRLLVVRLDKAEAQLPAVAEEVALPAAA